MPRIRSCILKCQNVKTFYEFPKDEHRRRKWLEIFGINGPTKKFIYACERHFSENMRLTRKLNLKAIPDMNLPHDTEEHIYKEEQLAEDKQPRSYIQAIENLNNVSSCIENISAHKVLTTSNDDDDNISMQLIEYQASSPASDDQFAKEVIIESIEPYLINSSPSHTEHNDHIDETELYIEQIDNEIEEGEEDDEPTQVEYLVTDENSCIDNNTNCGNSHTKTLIDRKIQTELRQRTVNRGQREMMMLHTINRLQSDLVERTRTIRRIKKENAKLSQQLKNNK